MGSSNYPQNYISKKIVEQQRESSWSAAYAGA